MDIGSSSAAVARLMRMTPTQTPVIANTAAHHLKPSFNSGEVLLSSAYRKDL
jgi:hypothetical protein